MGKMWPRTNAVISSHTAAQKSKLFSNQKIKDPAGADESGWLVCVCDVDMMAKLILLHLEM